MCVKGHKTMLKNTPGSSTYEKRSLSEYGFMTHRWVLENSVVAGISTQTNTLTEVNTHNSQILLIICLRTDFQGWECLWTEFWCWFDLGLSRFDRYGLSARLLLRLRSRSLFKYSRLRTFFKDFPNHKWLTAAGLSLSGWEGVRQNLVVVDDRS